MLQNVAMLSDQCVYIETYIMDTTRSPLSDRKAFLKQFKIDYQYVITFPVDETAPWLTVSFFGADFLGNLFDITQNDIQHLFRKMVKTFAVLAC